jgi:hypothetical protein
MTAEPMTPAMIRLRIIENAVAPRESRRMRQMVAREGGSSTERA